jgi:hypothetical protein
MSTVAFENTTTTIAARVNNQVSIAVLGSGSNASTTAASENSLTIAASITAQPSGSSVNAKLTAGDPGGILDYAGAGLSWDNDQAMSGINDTQTSARPAQINYSPNDKATAWTGTAGATLGTVTFTPTAVGTYTVTVWNELAAINATIATVGTAEDGAAAALSGADPSITFTVIVSAGVSTVTLAPVNSTSVEDAVFGSLVKVTLKDAAGNAAALSQGESLTLTPTLTGKISHVAANGAGVGVATGATAGAAWSLTAADFSSGIAWVNVNDAAAETVTVTASISGTTLASTSLTFKARPSASSDPVATLEPDTTTTGFAGTTDTYTTPLVSSVTYVLGTGFVATGSTTTKFQAFTLHDVAGKITGQAGSKQDVAINSVTGATYTVSATFTAASQTYVMSDIADAAGATDTAFGTTPNTLTSAAVNIAAGTVNALVTDTVLPNLSTLRATPASTVSFNVTVSDQFGDAVEKARVVMSWAGRNASTAATQVVGYTDATGVVALSYTDTALSTVTATADTVTFTAYDGTNSSTSTSTVTWVTTTVGTITLTSTGDTDTIAGTTKTDISAAKAGATGTSATASALVKDANGVIIVGVPVTFTVSGLVGAEVHTTTATVYTDATGTAVGNVSSYAAGKATVTATAGTISATDDLYFSQQTLTEARTISAVASGNNVIATVKDRYGNTIEGVTVNATRVGTGFFGTGASTATGVTNASGVIEFQYNGAGTVTVAFSTTTYGQSSSAAGYVGTSAVTAAAAGTNAANQTGLGASLAPAGVNSVAVAVEAAVNSADTAADAAAEATDAANAATDAANAAAEAADAATAAAQDAADAVAALSAQVATLVASIKAQITSLTALVIKIQKKVKA